MAFTLFKKKPEKVAGLMTAQVLAFIDGFRIPGASRLSLAETYILAEWLQIASIVSAGGGATPRVLKIIEVYAQKEFIRGARLLISLGKLSADALPAYVDYIAKESPSRREEYDSAGSLKKVANIALKHIPVDPIPPNVIPLATESMEVIFANMMDHSVTALKKVA